MTPVDYSSQMTEYQRAVKENRSALIQDLQEDVIEELRSTVLSEEEYLSIENEVSTYDTSIIGIWRQYDLRTRSKVGRFLDIMENKSDGDIKRFIEALKEWYNWLHILFSNRILEESVKTILINGGCPPLSPFNIPRRQSQEVRHLLSAMRDNSFLVLHGLPGSGKTTLAVEALHDYELVNNTFKNKVFWLTVGSRDDSAIITLLENINARLRNEREINLSSDPEYALIQLRDRFLSNPILKHSLIVLDDVHDMNEKQFGSILDQLNLGIRFLITTSDICIISENLRKITTFFKVDDGFNEHETKQLLSSSTGIHLNDIPQSEAKEIHKLCKGLPIMVSLIAAQLADEEPKALQDRSRWKKYVKKLSSWKRSSLDNIDNPLIRQIHRTIEISINSLKEKEYFEYFVIFLEDVNISTEVLSTLWSVETSVVEDIMTKFMKKTLVLRKWCETKKSYVYGVHDLVLNYLRRHMPKGKVMELHKQLVEKYSEKCGYNLSKLPKNDDYIFYFIGRHLKKANMIETMRQIYWDFEFLEAKMLAVEPIYLLRDLTLYREIIIDEVCDADYNSLFTFIEWNKNWIRQGVDLAQLALHDPGNKFIYNKGLDLVNRRKEKAYLKFPLGAVKRKEFQRRTINVESNQMSYVCFAHSTDHVLVGEKSGAIHLWNSKCNKIEKTYNEHLEAINHITVSSDGFHFVSSSADCTVRRWRLNNCSESHSQTGEFTPSPTRCNFVPIWDKSTDEESLESFQFSNPCIWSCLTSTSIGTICQKRGNARTEIFINSREQGQSRWDGYDVRFCIFSEDDRYLLGGGPSGLIFIDLIAGRECTRNMPRVFFDIIGLYTLPGKIVTVANNRVDCWGIEKPTNHSRMVQNKNDVTTGSYRLCHVADHIAIGTSNNEVIVLDRENGDKIQFIQNKGKKKLLHVGIKKGKVLAAYEDSTIDIIPIDESTNPKPYMSWIEDIPYLVKVVDTSLIQVHRGTGLLYEYESPFAVRRVSSLSKDLSVAFFNFRGEVCVVYPECGVYSQVQLFTFDSSLTYLSILDYGETSAVVASSERSPVKIWMKVTRETITLNEKSVRCVAAGFNSEGYLFTLSQRGVCVWKIAMEASLMEWADFHSVVLDPLRSRYIVYKKKEIIPKGFNVGCFVNSAVFELKSDIEKCCFSPDGSKLAIFAGDDITVYDFGACKAIHEWPRAIERLPTCMAVSNNGDVCVGSPLSPVIVFSGKGVASACIFVLDVIASPFTDVTSRFSVLDKFGDIHILEMIPSSQGL